MGRLHGFLTFGPLEPFCRRVAIFISYAMWPRVLGRRHVPRTGPLVVGAGQPGPAKASLLVVAVARPLHVVARLHILNRLLRIALRLRGVFPIHDVEIGYDERNAESLRRASDAVRQGRAVLVFPQRRSDEVGTAAARIAVAARAPLLPAMTYTLWQRRSVRRALVALRRPLRPPGADARSRRALQACLHRRMDLLGSLRHGSDHRAVLNVFLDDRHLWRRPLDVVRGVSRLGRRFEVHGRRLGRMARALQRSCRRLRCSPDDVRHPPGLADAGILLLLTPFALLGILLCAPPRLLLAVVLLGASDNRRLARMNAGLLLALPWGLALAGAGWILAGAAGALLPVVALGGLLCGGFWKSRVFRVLAIPGARRHGRRLRPLLRGFDEEMARIVSSAPAPGPARSVDGLSEKPGQSPA